MVLDLPERVDHIPPGSYRVKTMSVLTYWTVLTLGPGPFEDHQVNLAFPFINKPLPKAFVPFAVRSLSSENEDRTEV